VRHLSGIPLARHEDVHLLEVRLRECAIIALTGRFVEKITLSDLIHILFVFSLPTQRSSSAKMGLSQPLQAHFDARSSAVSACLPKVPLRPVDGALGPVFEFPPLPSIIESSSPGV